MDNVVTNKRTDAQIFILGHKAVDYGVWDNALYTPLEVGAALREPVFAVRDNTGANISDWNQIYAETTGTYWIANNTYFSYAGQCQYRRRLEFPLDFDFKSAFEKYGAICAEPINIGNVYDQYCLCHCKQDMDLVEAIINDKYPQLAEAYEKYIKKSGALYYSNSFVLNGDDYKEYAEVLFGILDIFKEERQWNTPEEALRLIGDEVKKRTRGRARGVAYQSQVFGFLSERLWTMWVQSKFTGRIKNIKYKKYEGV